ncbi:MAG: DUF4397 domain-containing protein [Myxococcota bacterium]
MARYLLLASGATVLLLSWTGCFVVPSTVGNPCTVDEDCGAGQLCQESMCVVGDADADSSTAEPFPQDSTGLDGDATDDAEPGDSTGIAAEGTLRFVHGSPDIGPLDVYDAASGELLAQGLVYGDASDWQPLDVGSYTFEVRLAGASVDEGPVYMGAPVDLAEDERISAVAVGLASGVDDDAFRLLTVREDWGTNLAGRARARIVHAGADAPSLAVDGLEGPPFELARFGDSAAVGLPLDVAGGERIELLESDDVVTTFTTPPFTEGDQVLIIATGLLGSLAREPDGFSLIAVGSDGPLGRVLQDPELFTLHGARDAGNLENCTNGFEVAANFNYGEIQSSFLSPGEYDFELHPYPSGCTGAALNPGGNASGPLEAGERYLLLLTGEQSPDGGEPAIQVAPFRDRFPIDEPNAAAIRFVHGASAEQIYVGNVTDGEVRAEDIYTTPIAWRSESEEVILDERPYLLGVADAVGEPSPPLTPLVTFDYVATPGGRLWGIVSGDPSPEAGDGVIQLMLLETATPQWTVQLVDIN